MRIRRAAVMQSRDYVAMMLEVPTAVVEGAPEN